MRIPGADRAIVEEAKLVDYCLNNAHPRGRHKARVFRSRLNIGPENFAILQDALLLAAQTPDAAPGEVDSFGERYIVDFELGGPGGTAVVRSAWIVRAGEDFPRLATCYVL
jgi:hypothetical protein